MDFTNEQLLKALERCIKENEGRTYMTGHVVVPSLCRSASERIKELMGQNGKACGIIRRLMDLLLACHMDGAPELNMARRFLDGEPEPEPEHPVHMAYPLGAVYFQQPGIPTPNELFKDYGLVWEKLPCPPGRLGEISWTRVE